MIIAIKFQAAFMVWVFQVVNALSDKLILKVCRDGGEYIQEYENGRPKAKLKKVKASKETGT
jgi:DNA gyrase subunit B